MEIKKAAVAGTMESSDVYVEIKPASDIAVQIESVVAQQFGEEPTRGESIGYIDVAWQMVQKGRGFALCFLPGEYTNPYGLCLTPLYNADGSPVSRDTWLLYPQNKHLNENVERFVDFILQDKKRAGDAAV